MMTLMEWGAIGELIGGVAIIVSLIYVGVQIRQSTKAAKVATSHVFLHVHAELLAPISEDRAFRDIYWRGIKGVSNLKDSETAAFAAWMMCTFRAWETFWYQWQEGVFDDHLWAGWKTQFCDLFGNTGVVELWSTREHQLSEQFRKYVREHTIDAESRPLYIRQDAGT